MADNSVFITGAAEGAFTDALKELPAWATENTAESIEKILKKSLDIQTKALSQLVKGAGGGAGSLSPEDAKKANDELAKLSKNLADENKQVPKKKKNWRDEDDEFKKQKKRWAQESTAQDKLLYSYGLVVSAGNAIRKTLEDNIDTYDRLTSAGISVVSGFDSAASGLEALQQLSVITGVRFTELSKTIEKYSGAINSFGLNKFAKTLGASTNELLKFGFNSKEAGDLLGAYLESQRGYTDVNSRTQDEVQKDLIKFGSRISALSIATGQSTAKLLENIQSLSQSVDANILAGQVGQDAAESTLEFIASFKDQRVGQAFLRMMTDSIKPLNDTFMNFQKLGFGGFGQKLMNFTKSLELVDDPKEKQRMTAEFTAANKQEIKVMNARANLFRQLGVKEADGVLAMTTGLEQQARLYKKESPEEKAKREATSKATKALQTEYEKFNAQLQRTFYALLPMLQMLTSGLEKVNKAIDGIRAGFNSFEEYLIKIGVIQKKIDIIQWGGFAVAIISAIAGLKMLTTAFKWAFGGIFGKKGRGNIADHMPGSRGAGSSAGKNTGPGLLSKIGQGIGDIGKGLGTGLGGLVGGFLKGLAEGLTALGTTKVLKGVVALAGIAGALWIAGKAANEFVSVKWDDMGKAGAALLALSAAGIVLGKSNPMMLLGAAGLIMISGALYISAKAIKQFSDISWEDMGKGIATLGALAAAAVLLGLPVVAVPAAIGGAIIAGLSAVLWGFGKAAASAAPGIKALAESFMEFGKIDGKNLTLVAGGIMALTGALLAFAGGNIASGVGNTLGSINDGISKLFGGDSILGKLKEFAAIGPGLSLFASSLGIVGKSIDIMSTALNAFSGLDKLQSIISAINTLDPKKAAAFGNLGNAKAVSLPNLTSTSNMSISKSPKLSTLNSPSAVSTAQASTTQATKDKEINNSTGPGIEKATSETSINSILDYQNILLQQLVMSTESLVSVNRDILKYTRANV